MNESSTPLRQQSLVVLSGPIAAGKSTLARALAQHLADAQITAAGIDFDLIVDMVTRSGDFPGAAQSWSMARRAAATLTDGFFDAGISVVVIEGDFWNPWARNDFEPYLRSGIAPAYVTLLVSYDEALARIAQEVADAPSVRPNSRDPVFLREVHDRFVRCLPKQPPTDLVLDSERHTTVELVTHITDTFQLLPTRRAPR